MARVVDAANTMGLSIVLRTMDQSTRTAEEAAVACGCDVGQIVKSLVFRDTEGDVLVLMLLSGQHNADLDHVREAYGLKLERADTRRVRDETGFAIGGVAPIGHKQPLPIYIDEALLDYSEVWAAAGRPDSVFGVDPNVLAKAIGAERITVRSD
ncbi:MAG: YbaK/EbsC family protein [Pseudomonadota bacterium]